MNISRRGFFIGGTALGGNLLFPCLSSAAALDGSGRPRTVANPIFDGWYADPQIRRYGDEWWVFPTTSAPFQKQTSFDAFSSKDMKTWTKHSRVLTVKEVSWARGAMWAPDAHKIGGKYYLFFSANDAYPVGGRREDGVPQGEVKLHGYGGIGVAVADRPEGPYRDLIGKPLIDRFWNRAQPIDQYVFEYKGEWYMIYGGWRRCNLVKLAKDFRSLVPFEDGAMWRDMTPKGYVEGSVMFERKGRWYFMYSCGSWGRKSRLRRAPGIIPSSASRVRTSGTSATTVVRSPVKDGTTASSASTAWSSIPTET